MSRISLGPFELSHRVGRGGMGDVYRGRHVTQGVDVAVKVITSEQAKNTRYLKAFRNEVHSMARLDHPNIIMVFDVGEISAEAEALSGGRMTAGSPFLAMELATHGSLSRVREGLHWKRLRAVLYAMLDSLAHAHARGVIHRDLKPGNVLLTQSADGGPPTLKLVDFGLAHAMDAMERDDLTTSEDPEKTKIAGTPRYMAPEQIEGRWRDQGPWTDLYAVGCLAHYLVNGQPPFSGDLEQILTGHLFEPAPPLQPRFEIPPGFEDWVNRLLAKSPTNRFRRAADAAYELLDLGDVSERLNFNGFAGSLEEITEQTWTETEFLESSQVPSSNSGIRTDGSHQALHTMGAFTATMTDIPAREARSKTTLGQPYVVRAPMPLSWRRDDVVESSMKIVGAGLGLYGVRSIPLIARGRERDRAWDVLGEVYETGATRVLAFRGGAGLGKSRLAEWLCERSHETGVAQILKATSARSSSSSEGLRRMMAHALRTHGLTRRDARTRIHEQFITSTGTADLFECQALAHICVPGSDDSSMDDIAFLSPTERFAIIRRYITRLSRERPVIIWLDDVQWSVEALEFVTYLLQADETAKAPICVMMTIRDEAVVGGSLESKLIDSVQAHRKASVVRIEALPPHDHERLVRELLSLEGELAKEVAERTGGNPLFAVQLVGDWVQRGVLEVRPQGFSLREGETAPVPRTIRQVWRERITRLVLTYDAPGPARMALELAAALGDEIDGREWDAACKTLGVDVPEDFSDRMIESRMAIRSEMGWSFSHGMLRETLLKEFENTRQAVRYHRAIVEALSELYGSGRRDIRERIATHQLAAKDFSRALEPLLEGASWRNQTCDFEQARRLLELHAQTLRRLRVPESDERWGQNWLLHISSLLRQGIVNEEAQELIDRGNRLAEEYHWECHPTFIMRRASLARKLGSTDEAEHYYLQALNLFRNRDLHGVGRCLYGIGEVYMYRGDLSRSLDFFEEAFGYIPKSSESHALALTGIANVLTRLDRGEDARPYLNEAIQVFERLGNRMGLASALNALGELERRRGHFVEAARAYNRSKEILQAIGSKSVIIPKMNLGLMGIANGHYREARVLLEEGLAEIHQAGERSHLGLLYVALLPCVAADQDWDGWDHYISMALRAISDSATADRDIVEHAELAERIAGEHGELERALQARALAASQRAAIRVGVNSTN